MHLTIFDLDRTLLKTNISFTFYLYLYKKKIFEKKSIFEQLYFFIKFKYFNMSLQEIHKRVFNKYLKNKKYKKILDNVDIFLDKYLIKTFYMPAVLKLQEAIKKQHYICLLSSSPFFLVEPIAKILKINDFQATFYSIDNEGKFSKLDVIMDGKAKSKYVNLLIKSLNITRKNITVYSDSIDDKDLFDIAHEKVAVNPCRKLNKLAKEKNWEII